MQKKEKIFIASLIGFLLIWLTFQSVIYFPELYLRDNILISEEMEPPGDLDADLDMSHQHFVYINIHQESGTYDIEFEVRLDNETFNRIRFYQSGNEGGDGISQFIIPIDEESTGEFEIIVIKSVGVRSVEYKIFIDPTNFFIFFRYDLGKWLPLGFMIMFVAFFIYICLKTEKKR
jgi:hypothetical protein